MIGGTGERKTLRLVAQYADACNLFATGADEVAAQARRAPRALRRRRPRLRRESPRPSSAPSTVRSTTSTPGSPRCRSTPTSASARSGSAPDAADPVGWTEQMCDEGAPPTRRDRRLSPNPRRPARASLPSGPCRPAASSSSTGPPARGRRRWRRLSSVACAPRGWCSRWICSTRSGPGPTPTSPTGSGRTSSIAPVPPTTAPSSAPPRAAATCSVTTS